jgi:hypothetical protein
MVTSTYLPLVNYMVSEQKQILFACIVLYGGDVCKEVAILTKILLYNYIVSAHKKVMAQQCGLYKPSVLKNSVLSVLQNRNYLIREFPGVTGLAQDKNH